ncbi:MAG: hypothetical protein FJ267_07940 [Planctomycetes bacterium]|nr:hypothetical protein [Planctomycetota bacterium]
MSWGRFEWRPYVPVAKRKVQGSQKAAALAKKEGRQPSPVILEGRKITTTFWGKAWCENLERYSDFSNRLPRGATYVRNGSVVDLVIETRKIKALVSGSEVYTVTIEIDALDKKTWKTIKEECSSSIDSLLDLLAGKFSDGVMQRLTQKEGGLFPTPKQIHMNCNCPDWSSCCKHISAVMYGVGARLDLRPELLFLLRDVDHQELVTQAVSNDNLNRELGSQETTLAGEDLSAMFGIDLGTSIPDSDTSSVSHESSSTKPAKSKKPRTSKPKAVSPKKAEKAAAVSSKSGSDQPKRVSRKKLPAPADSGLEAAAIQVSAQTVHPVRTRSAAKTSKKITKRETKASATLQKSAKRRPK